jgi:hypothetical protein
LTETDEARGEVYLSGGYEHHISCCAEPIKSHYCTLASSLGLKSI